MQEASVQSRPLGVWAWEHPMPAALLAICILYVLLSLSMSVRR
jgi:hypothetical protein